MVSTSLTHQTVTCIARQILFGNKRLNLLIVIILQEQCILLLKNRVLSTFLFITSFQKKNDLHLKSNINHYKYNKFCN